MKIEKFKEGLTEDDFACPKCGQTIRLWFDKEGNIGKVSGGERIKNNTENIVKCYNCYAEWKITK